MADEHILTRSGRRVACHVGAPSLLDIACSLHRLPRFGGHLDAEWSVLDHTMLVAGVVAFENPQVEGYARVLAALLHDAHESVTGDIPTPYKTSDIRCSQSALDAGILASLDLPLDLLIEHRAIVRAADRQALLLEAELFHPALSGSRELVAQHFGDAAGSSVRQVMNDLLALQFLGVPYHAVDDIEDHPTVQWFLNSIEAARQEAGI